MCCSDQLNPPRKADIARCILGKIRRAVRPLPLEFVQGVAPVLWGEVAENPTGDDVSAGAEAFKQAGCDGVIALGGGSGLGLRTFGLAGATRERQTANARHSRGNGGETKLRE